ncbi:portal protein [Candidatus Woesearchaeota archaeon]|jgi:hypothetical protein|nr:portal protein [Candidatus Woesearchaeota archaeon]MBT6128839.1 portal protein [Candidatus Neomarinimicrobiota bacterium]MBT7556272.1 portal protein [Candidatus Woesearchaeota archaeon]
MADTSIRARLFRLFSGNVIVRNVGGRKLKVADTSKVQYLPQKQLVDRYQRLFSTGKGLSGYSDTAMVRSMRLGLFRDYESMDSDSIISSALDVYSDESTMKSEYGDVLTINSDNDQIKQILHNLFYDILNVEFNLWSWVRNMCKYGDFFLHLEIDDKYGVKNVVPLSSYDVVRLEGIDPENPEYVKFVLESADPNQTKVTHTQQEFENFEIAHFRLLGDSNYLPYGKAMVEGGRKTWKQLSLMEDAMLIHRIMRAPEKRVFKIDIGNIPPNEVDNYMQQIINKMKKAPVVEKESGDYNLRYNMQNITEDFFVPVRGGDSGTQIDSLPGLTYEAVEDIEYLRNKLMAALKIPKAFLGYEEQVGSKATLAAEDVRFARTIERIQRIIVSELTKIAIVHLYVQGYTDADLVNFDLGLTNPSTIYEQEKIELWTSKTSLASSMLQDGIVSTDWIYRNIFGFTEEEIKKEDEGIVFDFKQKFRRGQIETEGNDPAKSGESQGTPSDLAMGRTGHELEDEGGAPEGGQPGAGRPKEGPHYGKDGSARGRDPLGKHDKRKGGSGAPKYGKSLALAHVDKLKGTLIKPHTKILTESEEVKEEYDKEINSKS